MLKVQKIYVSEVKVYEANVHETLEIRLRQKRKGNCTIAMVAKQKFISKNATSKWKSVEAAGLHSKRRYFLMVKCGRLGTVYS